MGKMDKQGNNIDSVAKLLAEHGEFIYRVALNKTNDKNAADDLVQNFLLSVISNPIPHYIENVKSYIYKAIVNDNLDSIRKIKGAEAFFKKYCKNSNFLIHNDDSQNAYNREEWVSKIFAIMSNELTSFELQAIKLKYKDECSIEDIAKKMNIKKASVSKYICVGLKKIKKVFEQKWGNYDNWL
jgi:RNA polymerase sigma factor (sigma-70 family)